MSDMKNRSTPRKLRVIIIIISLILVGIFFSRCSTPEKAYPRDEAPRLEEVWSFGSGDIKVVRIPLTGVIMRAEDEGFFTAQPDMVENILMQIRAADRDPEMRAIILEVNSPGGGVTPSDEIYNALSRFRTSRPDRHVVVFIRDLGASGAYYAAMAGDFILAEPTAAIGSIGVIMQTLNLEGLSKKFGITDVTIKSGVNKDMLNPFRPVDTNQVELLQELIDDMQARFAGIVSESRNLDPSSTPELFDGRIFSASLALEKGLIDGIGYWDDALTHTARLFETNTVHVVRYETEKTFLESLISGHNPVPLPNLRAVHAPRFLYLWKP